MNYVSNIINAVFYESGNTIPTLNWNGNTGIIKAFAKGLLKEEELNINENTGKITWTRIRNKLSKHF